QEPGPGGRVRQEPADAGRRHWEPVREIAMAAHRVLAAGGKARGGGDVDPSATTSNAATGRNDPVPSGFGRRGAVCYVAAPRRCPASPSSRRLAYGPTASRTRPLIFLGPAPGWSGCPLPCARSAPARTSPRS